MKTERPRFQLNRGLVVIRYKQPYIDWIKTAGEAPMEITLEQANEDGELFLLPTKIFARQPTALPTSFLYNLFIINMLVRKS